MAIPSFSSTVVARVAGGLYGLQLGSSTMASVMTEANASGGINGVINAVYARDFGSASNAAVADRVVANLGLTGAQAAEAKAYVVAVLDAAPADGKGVAIAETLGLFASLDMHPSYGAAASAFNARIATAVTYAQQTGTVDRALNAGTALGLTLGVDYLTGTPGADTMIARIFNNANSLQSGDWIDGGAGNDRLEADMGTSANFAVTPETISVETIAIRAQATQTDSGDNNVAGVQRVKIDAERIVGATRFESNNSRADVVIEDVRILPSQITKDITIAFVESDPGHVDYAVYFDQLSLKNQVSNTSSINLQIMDTVAAAAGLAPLLNSNYGAFTFTVTVAGVPRQVTLGSQAIQDAQTYAQLAAAFQAALDAEFGPGSATASVGDNFTVVDPASRIAVTGQNIVLTTNTAVTFSTPTGSGWLADGVAPPASNFYTNFFTGSTATNSLVTSTVILDDVGRGSTGGDLVIGGLSVGSTSSSLGVQRFEIEVRDNSKLESMNSTNNTLREVTIKNGETTSGNHAYGTTVKDAGNLTVNGNSGTNGQNVSGQSNRVTVGTTTDGTDAASNNAVMPGVQSTTQGGAAIQAYGFTDVRLIDASAMAGKFEFTAQVTSASLAKYLNLKDIQANPGADNVAFSYFGGANDDTFWVRLDTNFAGSRNTIMAGREDFTFNANGGAGNDWINVALTPNPGGDQAWYTNQKLNKNITLDGGAGDDVIRKPGAGDFAILGGTGNDTIYADNSGTMGIAVTSGGSSLAGAVYSAAAAAELASFLALANQSNSTNDTAAVAFTPLAQPLNTTNALNALNLLTPISFTDPANPANPNPLLPTRAALDGAIRAAVLAEQLTPAQGLALIAAYNTATGVTVTPAAAVTDPLSDPTISAGVAVGGALTAAEFAAGNALLDTYITEAEAALATATGSDASLAAQWALLNVTQRAVAAATIAVNGVASTEGGGAFNPATGVGTTNGSATILAGLNTLAGALVVGTPTAQVVAAITAAVQAQIITSAQGLQLYTAATSVSAADNIDAAELFAIQGTAYGASGLTAQIATATATNATNVATLNTAIADDNAAIAAAAALVGASPIDPDVQLGVDNVGPAAAIVAGDALGSAEAAAAQTAAAAALTAFNATAAPLTVATNVQTGLANLKAALAAGTSDLNVTTILAAAVAANTITGGQATDIQQLTFPGAPQPAGTISAAEKAAIDVYITALQQANDITVDALLVQRTSLQANVTATTFAAAQALAAANASPNAGTPLVTADKAVWVLNTANQTAAPTPYVLNINDERNLADLKSDVNNTYNFYAATLTVTFKDLTATVNVPNTGFRTTDLQINQAIKDAVNNNVVLNKLISAADGPANTLVITSLIDGVMSNANFGVSVTLPALAGIVDVAGAAAVYGTASTAEAVLAAMQAALASFNTKGDYVDQLAETGAFGGNVQITGAASTTTSDNTITPGADNDVIVLGTTVGSDALLSSNDRVVYGPAFGNDTIVHFRAGSQATGGDVLVLSALGGSILGTAFNVNNSINVANEVAATNGTAALVAALFTDSATAQTHVYVAVDPLTNIGKVYSVTDAAGIAASGVVATLAGTIDLADTLWSTLTIDNFA